MAAAGTRENFLSLGRTAKLPPAAAARNDGRGLVPLLARSEWGWGGGGSGGCRRGSLANGPPPRLSRAAVVLLL